MSIDPPVIPQSTSSSAPQRILLRASHLALRDSRERAIYKKFKDWSYAHMPVLDETLLYEAGMADELDTIF
jgi:hypothetical protein